MSDVGRPRATSSPSWSVMTLSEVTGLPVSVIWSDLQNGILSGTTIQGKTIIRLEDLMASKRDSYRLVAENLGNTSRKEPKDEDDGPILTVRLPCPLHGKPLTVRYTEVKRLRSPYTMFYAAIGSCRI